MERINTATKHVDLFGAGKHGFRDGDPVLGVPATFLSATFFNSMQEELANLVEGAGIALNAGNRTQVREAIQKMIVAAQKTLIIDTATFEASVTNGEAVRWDSANNRFDEAIADGTVNNRAVGIADVTNGKVYVQGECALFSGLTPGATYFLSDSVAGGVTIIAPIDAIKVGIAKSATTMWLDIDPITSSGVIAGTMIDYGGGTVPAGYLECNGANVSRTTYAALFTNIGTAHGVGDGSTTFTLPDSRRRVSVGRGGTGTGVLGNALGNVGGTETHTLTIPEMPAHTHDVNNVLRMVGGSYNAFSNTADPGTQTTTSTGGGGAHNNMQPSLVVTKLIKF